jgi:hypothetical protein
VKPDASVYQNVPVVSTTPDRETSVRFRGPVEEEVLRNEPWPATASSLNRKDVLWYEVFNELVPEPEAIGERGKDAWRWEKAALAELECGFEAVAWEGGDVPRHLLRKDNE